MKKVVGISSSFVVWTFHYFLWETSRL